MKILLVGEYSRLHNSLKEGLTALGHETVIIACGDHFKKFNVDYSIYPRFLYDYWLTRKFKNLFYSLTNIDLGNYERAIRFYFRLRKLDGFDHVQLINSDALETSPLFSRFLYKKLFKKIKIRSLLICGEETPIIDYLLKKESKYSILTPYFENEALKKEFRYSFKYTKNNYRRTFDYLKENCQSLITSDLDYKVPMDRMGYETVLIPNPINISEIDYHQPDDTSKIVIFLGINRLSYLKKGAVYFEKALDIIRKKYPEKTEIIITENIPYADYINLYNKAHILLDQVYGWDQGYNALEAMAKGKVVFTGADKEFLQYYNLQEDQVAINALPDVNYIVEKLSFLIDNPHQIMAISKQARDFINKEHDYISIAKKYLESWKV